MIRALVDDGSDCLHILLRFSDIPAAQQGLDLQPDGEAGIRDIGAEQTGF